MAVALRPGKNVFVAVNRNLVVGCSTVGFGNGCRFVVVPQLRGQQLKEQAQLDSWLRDGSAAYVDSLCAWA